MSRELFTNLLDGISENNETFIGFGNPNSKILIIGKECSVEIPELNQITNIENSTRWKEWIKNGKQDKNWEDVPYDEESWKMFFDPSHPFRGELNKRRRKLKNGKWNGGTSPTWCWYQKLLEHIRNIEEPSKTIDFYNYCFLTELSAVSKKYSHDGDKKETIASIITRKSLFENDFFQSFPIVIAACKGYLNNIDLKSTFPNSKVIISRQLSMNVSYKETFFPLLEEVKNALLEKNLKI